MCCFISYALCTMHYALCTYGCITIIILLQCIMWRKKYFINEEEAIRDGKEEASQFVDTSMARGRSG